MTQAIAENHPITKLDPMNTTHRRVARLLAQGLTHPEIADYLDLSEGTVRNYALDQRSRDMIDYLDVCKRKQNILDKDTFDVLQSKAIRTYEEILETGTTDQKIRVSAQILDRHPDGVFTKSSKLKHESTGAVATNDTIMELKRRASIVDAEVIDISPSSPPRARETQDFSPSLPESPPISAEVVV